MSAMKAIFTELQELDMEVDFNNRDDLFYLVIDARLSNFKLSPLMCKAVLGSIEDNESFLDLLALDEFVSAMEWHIA